MTRTAAPRCQFGPLTIEYDERVLEPRAWTFEQSRWAVELAADAEPGPLLELCAGAGHIGLAAAVLADRDLVQVEADPSAATYARRNAIRAGWGARTDVRCERMQTALSVAERFPVVLADPPYLRSDQVKKWPADPPGAIDGGTDGLDLIRVCLDVAVRHLAESGRLLLQVAGPRQADQVDALLDEAGLRREAVRIVDSERAIVLLSTA